MLFPRIVVLLGAGAASLFVAACDHNRARTPAAPRAPLREVVQLDCPQREGVLRLVKVSNDGRICDYVGRAGEEVRLRIVPLDGQTPDIALAPLEAELKAYLPRREPSDPEALAAGDEDAGDGGNDRANISLPGINIDADDDSANIQIGGLTINANDDAANIRIDRRSESERRVIIEGEQVPAEAPVAPRPRNPRTHLSPALMKTPSRSCGAGPTGAMSPSTPMSGALRFRIYAGRSVRITYILASNEAGPAGYRVVGYVARGPDPRPAGRGLHQGQVRQPRRTAAAHRTAAEAQPGGLGRRRQGDRHLAPMVRWPGVVEDRGRFGRCAPGARLRLKSTAEGPCPGSLSSAPPGTRTAP